MPVSSKSSFLSRRTLLKGCAMLALAGALSFSTASSSLAQSLNDLRANGKVGEAFDGFARARNPNVEGIVLTINKKRRLIYMERAQQQGTDPQQVGAIYADKIIAKSPSGTWLLMRNGSWHQK